MTSQQKGKYQRTVSSTTIDVYDVLEVFGVTCPARQHAVKKLLAAGQRGAKNATQDLQEAAQAIERAIELEANRVSRAVGEDLT